MSFHQSSAALVCLQMGYGDHFWPLYRGYQQTEESRGRSLNGLVTWACNIPGETEGTGFVYLVEEKAKKRCDCDPHLPKEKL